MDLASCASDLAPPPQEDFTGLAALCIGWDVGGWHGRKDGLAALLLRRNGTVAEGRGYCSSLGGLIASGLFSVKHLLSCLSLLRDEPWPRIVVGADAPLGLPTAFIESTTAPLSCAGAMCGKLADRMINNPLAYRDTERVIFEMFRNVFRPGWRPLSPTFDRMGSNISKARSGVAQLRANDGPGRVSVVPFDADEGAIAVLEVYPALWDVATVQAPRNDQLQTILAIAAAHASPHVGDALRCALTAASYELTRTNTPALLPRVMLPPTAPASTQEGWIFAPILCA